ncbi:glycosyltransferase family 8 protein [Marinilongibacter aquaticus]|uniref:glycosyltransferase family 8 protein n=1 Tax=Marinilongibacter aquaticus TaxID=2975157 RepID=UPI0021BD71A0|nr:glycosyltransferase family 8 protein [Marinilongibacter aquaticus]UBM57642.1 glycosyltransferase family 8 protein [Marinilongibacter aquaticus]
MNIVYSCDRNYLEHTGISIISLLENNSDNPDIHVFLISIDIPQRELDQIKGVCDSYNCNFSVISFENLARNLNVSHTGRHIKSVYSKLFFGFLPVDRAIYLDSDTIVVDTLKEMWQIDLEDNYFCLLKTISKSSAGLLGFSREEPFFNDGVAVVNCSKLRKDNLHIKFLNAINDYDGVPPCLSEGVINLVCRGKISVLPPRFNFVSAFFLFSNKGLRVLSEERDYISDADLEFGRQSPVIIHYLSEWLHRPWNSNCTHPRANHYLYYKGKSPWKSKKLSKGDLNRSQIVLKGIYNLLGSEGFVKAVFIYRKLKEKFKI